jgi:hypothetical protein
VSAVVVAAAVVAVVAAVAAAVVIVVATVLAAAATVLNNNQVPHQPLETVLFIQEHQKVDGDDEFVAECEIEESVERINNIKYSRSKEEKKHKQKDMYLRTFVTFISILCTVEGNFVTVQTSSFICTYVLFIPSEKCLLCM